MSARAAMRLAAVLAIAAVPQAVRAERMVLSLSAATVTIRSNFTGTDVVLFGAVVGAPAPPPAYDLVVAVVGPAHNLTARRKAPVGGLWLNTDSRTFIAVPDYFALLANRPFARIADEPTRRRLGLTPVSRIVPGAAAAAAPDLGDFRAALIRLKTGERLWTIRPSGVDFIIPTLFRATIPIPADVPVGGFTIEAVLFAGGAPVATAQQHLVVEKSGFEDQVVQWAENDAVLYGLGSAAMALAFGFLASVAFRR
jgi:uncharacterized protein (TIGR02186 family)